MLKMNNNLMSINKLLLFFNNLIDEDINVDLFSAQINFEINFVKSILDKLWEEYTNFVDIYEKENFVKSYYFIIKRYHKFLYKLKNHLLIIKKINIEEAEINDILKIIQFRINLIRENNFNIKYVDTKKQCINEEEYSILFEKE